VIQKLFGTTSKSCKDRRDECIGSRRSRTQVPLHCLNIPVRILICLHHQPTVFCTTTNLIRRMDVHQASPFLDLPIRTTENYSHDLQVLRRAITLSSEFTHGVGAAQGGYAAARSSFTCSLAFCIISNA